MRPLFLAACLALFPVFAQAAFLSKPKTIEEIEKKLAEIPPERSYRARATLLSELGTRFYREGRWDDAVQSFDTALGYGPPTILKKHIYLYMAKSQESAGRIDKAIAAYEQAALLDRRNWRRHRDLAGLYARVRLYEKAAASYEKALKYNPREASVHFSLGHVQRLLSRYEKAEKHLVAASDQGYNQTDVFSELNLVFEAQGKFSEAASAFQETLTDTSPPEQWARLVYLSLLARQADGVEKGLAGLRKRNVGPETIRYYEALKKDMLQ